MKESKIWRDIRDKLSSGPVRLFRNDVGHGMAVRHRSTSARQEIISLCIALASSKGGSAARLSYGLGVGTGDLIGFRCVEITPDMVGKQVAVFVSVECKTATGNERSEQSRWREYINSIGGIALTVRSVEQAKSGLDKVFTGVHIKRPGGEK